MNSAAVRRGSSVVTCSTVLEWVAVVLQLADSVAALQTPKLLLSTASTVSCSVAFSYIITLLWCFSELARCSEIWHCSTNNTAVNSVAAIICCSAVFCSIPLSCIRVKLLFLPLLPSLSCYKQCNHWKWLYTALELSALSEYSPFCPSVKVYVIV